MTKYILNFKSVSPFSKNKPEQAIILCHGYGGDGNDISALALNWQRFLPNAIFLCPDAPEICSVSPNGFQWFDLSSEKEDIILEKSLIAEEKLSKFIDQISENFQLNSNKLALVGFSQGCMISVQVGIKRQKQINCILGYSGKIINQSHLSKNVNSKPRIFLMHGENDAIVPPVNILEAKEFLKKHSISVKIKLFKNCEHRIPIEGSSLGLSFLKKNLL